VTRIARQALNAAGLAVLLIGAGAAAPPSPGPTATIVTPGPPFASVGTTDGKYLFVSISGSTDDGVAVYRTDVGQIAEIGFVAIDGAAGMALSRDDASLLVADGDGVAIVDAAAAETATSRQPLQVVDGSGAGAVEVVVTSDGTYAFVSNEQRASISVIRLARRPDGRLGGTVTGEIRVDRVPVGLAISNDGRFLYVTSEIEGLWASHSGDGDPAIARAECPYGPHGVIVPNGTITTIDVARAVTAPSKAVISRVAAGCSPVRVALTSDGKTAWVTAREDDRVFAFDTQRLRTDPDHALVASVAVGSAPVGLALLDGDAYLAVANSSRFGASAPSTIAIVALRGAPIVQSTVQVGIFPREFSLSADGTTLRLTNFGSSQLMLFDVKRLVGVWPTDFYHLDKGKRRW
jgi:DNA-binding beta-propeller fold protein YncE